MTADVHQLAEASGASVSAVCRALELPRSTAYARLARKREPSARAKDTAQLDVAVKAAFAASENRYGSPRVHRALRRQGLRVGRKRVAARMRALGLAARRRRRFRRTTQADPSHAPAPNLLNRRFEWDAPNQAWAGDITYVWTQTGWAYLAILVDLCTRKIVGWSVGEHCDTVLALRALNAAFARYRPGPGLIHHVDRGCTYTAAAYRERVREYGMLESMSRKGNCWDNAVAESTFGTIKAELLADRVPEGVEELQRMVFQYIEVFYNRNRLHSTLGYITPSQKEQLVKGPRQVA